MVTDLGAARTVEAWNQEQPDRGTPDLGAILDRIRERAAASEAGHGFLRTAHRQSAIDVLPLLKAVDAVLGRHQRAEIPTHCYDLDLRCIDHRLSALGMVAAGPVWACPDCSCRERWYCTGCHGEEEWPCPEVRDILAALTGTENADGSERRTRNPRKEQADG